MNPSRRNAYSLNVVVLFVLISTDEAYLYRAITSFEGIDHFYASASLLRDHVQRMSRSNDRKELCQQMFDHPYFRIRNVEWVDPDDDKDLSDIVEASTRISSALYTATQVPREHCPAWCYHGNSPEQDEKLSMLKQFYDDKPEELKKCITWCRYKTTEYIYDNTPKELSVVVGTGRYSESVFLCPVRTAKDRIDAYYVSENDYNMNEATSSDEIVEYIPGKFIFRLHYSRPSITISLVALAEDTARIKEDEAEKFYLHRDLNQTPTALETDDPVCMLDNTDKLRLCSSILNSEALRDRLEFSSAAEDSVTYACVKYEISFRSESPIPPGLRAQWMIGCEAKTSSGGSGRMFYVSRGYRVNSAYLYHTPGDQSVGVFLYQYYTNVSVLRA